VTVSEDWFDEYLSTNGYTSTPEPDLGVPTRPDRLIERVGVEAICEVKEFTTDAVQRRWPAEMRERWPEDEPQFGSFRGEEWLLNVRRAISDAARQLEPLAGDPRPLVIVLANPRRVRAEITGPKLIEAIKGELAITFRVSRETGAAVAEGEWVYGEGGRLAGGQAPWISAVAGLHRGDQLWDWQRKWIEDWKAEHLPEGPRSEDDALARVEAYRPALEEAMKTQDPPSGDYFYLHVIGTPSEDAVPLPRKILDAAWDVRWAENRETGMWELVV
jgi:hypothetical protein